MVEASDLPSPLQSNFVCLPQVHRDASPLVRGELAVALARYVDSHKFMLQVSAATEGVVALSMGGQGHELSFNAHIA